MVLLIVWWCSKYIYHSHWLYSVLPLTWQGVAGLLFSTIEFASFLTSNSIMEMLQTGSVRPNITHKHPAKAWLWAAVYPRTSECVRVNISQSGTGLVVSHQGIPKSVALLSLREVLNLYSVHFRLTITFTKNLIPQSHQASSDYILLRTRWAPESFGQVQSSERPSPFR